MTVRPYDRARFEAATGLFDWAAQQMSVVIPAAGYVPNLEIDTTVTVIQPFRSASIALLDQAVSPGGWLQCQPMIIGDIPVNEVIDQVVVYRSSDNALMFHISFPPVSSKTGEPLIIFYGVNSVGFGRL